MPRFDLQPTEQFRKKYKKLVSQSPLLTNKIKKTLIYLTTDPYYPSLKTHKIGEFRSSTVTGDIRIIWQFSDTTIEVIDLLDIGGHSGANKVY